MPSGALPGGTCACGGVPGRPSSWERATGGQAAVGHSALVPVARRGRGVRVEGACPCRTVPSGCSRRFWTCPMGSSPPAPLAGTGCSSDTPPCGRARRCPSRGTAGSPRSQRSPNGRRLARLPEPKAPARWSRISRSGPPRYRFGFSSGVSLSPGAAGTVLCVCLQPIVGRAGTPCSSTRRTRTALLLRVPPSRPPASRAPIARMEPAADPRTVPQGNTAVRSQRRAGFGVRAGPRYRSPIAPCAGSDAAAAGHGCVLQPLVHQVAGFVQGGIAAPTGRVCRGPVRVSATCAQYQARLSPACSASVPVSR
ncbi:hypothetical protein SUDANB120_06124 [Streptomyces sp. enrichment culture]